MRRDLLRPESRGSPRARWTTWCGPWATSRASRARRSRGSATGIDEGVHEFLSRRLDRTWFPHLFAGRHPPGRESGPEGGLPGPGGGHRSVGRRPPGDPGTWPWATPRPPISGRPSCGPCANGGSRSPPRRIPPGSCRPTGDAHAGIRAAVRAILPGAARQRCRAPLRPQHHHPGSARPDPSRSTPWSPRSSPRPRPRPSPPSTSTSSTLQGTPSLQNRSDADRRRAGPNGLRHDPSAPGSTGPRSGRSNPIERLNREIKRRADVVQVFPDRDSARPLIGPALPEQRGVAVRRTPLPVPDLPATPDRHAPGRQQHRRRQQSPRPAPPSPPDRKNTTPKDLTDGVVAQVRPNIVRLLEVLSLFLIGLRLEGPGLVRWPRSVGVGSPSVKRWRLRVGSDPVEPPGSPRLPRRRTPRPKRPRRPQTVPGRPVPSRSHDSGSPEYFPDTGAVLSSRRTRPRRIGNDTLKHVTKSVQTCRMRTSAPLCGTSVDQYWWYDAHHMIETCS